MLRYNDHEIKIGHFPDGSMLLKATPEIEWWDSKILWFYESDEELLALIYLTKHLRSHGVNNLSLVMPYVPNARMDRVKHDNEVFTLKYFAEIINSLNFYEVFVMDTHSHVTDALINNVRYIDHVHYINFAIGEIKDRTNNEDVLLFYPDQGSVKRYSDDVGMEYAFGIKNRDWNTGKILGLDVAGSADKIKGRNVLIVDDICSRGGTFYHSAKKLKELGAAKVYLYITHCENTIFEGELLDSDLIDHIYTTDSLLTKTHNKITTFQVMI